MLAIKFLNVYISFTNAKIAAVLESKALVCSPKFAINGELARKLDVFKDVKKKTFDRN